MSQTANPPIVCRPGDKWRFGARIIPGGPGSLLSSPLPAAYEVPEAMLKFTLVLTCLGDFALCDVEILTGAPDIETLRNYAERCAQGLIDAINHVEGSCITLSLINAIELEKATPNLVPFEPRHLVLSAPDRRPTKPRREEVLGVLFSGTQHGPLLARALADLREAIRNPHDTAFHAYRAVEALRPAFAEGSDDREELWQKLRVGLNVDEQSLKRLKDLRNVFAHGGRRHLPGDEREKVLLFAFQVVDRFVKWCLGKGQEIPEEVLTLNLDTQPGGTEV